MELETLKVCIDGVDCSGKTTLWNKLHKLSNYRWKLEDRSFVTMVVYAKLHGRKKIRDYERQLMNDLSNLNNKYVLINPSWEVVESRFHSRGDDLHDLEAMRKIHAIYAELISKVSKFPNVLVLTEENPEDAAKKAHEWLLSQNDIDVNGLISLIQQRVRAEPTGEVSPLRFSFLESGDFPEDEPRILDVNYIRENHPAIKPATVSEFNEMIEGFSDIVDKELRGDNLYGRKESVTSRRFVFTQNSCVSFIQAMIRDEMLKFYVTCRSSHVIDIFPADIRLMYHMAKIIRDKLKVFGLGQEAKTLFEFTLNSAHVVA